MKPTYEELEKRVSELESEINVLKKLNSTNQKNDDSLLKNLSAQIPGVIYQYRYHPDGRNYFPFASDNIFNIYAVTPEEVRTDGSKVLSRLHPEDYESVIAKIVKSFQTLDIWEDDYRVILPDVGERWLRGIAKPEKLDDESVLWHGYITDITDRKHIEQALKDSEEMFRQITENMDEVFWLRSADNSDMIYISPSYEKIWGRSNQELIENPAAFIESIFYKDKPKVFDAYDNYILNGGFNQEYRIVRPDGSIRWIHARTYPIYNSEGEIIKHTGSAIDITEKKLIELSLIESEKQLDNALKLAKMGKWMLDVDTGIFTFTDNFYRIYHTNADEIGRYQLSIDEYINTFVYHEDAPSVEAEAKKAFMTDDPNYNGYMEHRIKFYDGGIGYIAVRFFIENDDSGKTIKVFGVNQDITAQKKTENEIIRLLDNISLANAELEASIFQKNILIDSLEDTKQKLELSNREKDKFFSIIAHDLRSPFGGFIGLTKIMIDDIENLTHQEFHEYSKALHDSAVNLYKLLDNLLTWSSIKRDSIKFMPEIFNLRNSIQEICNVQQTLITNKNQKLFVDVPDEILVFADLQMVNSLLRNLLSNAVKFTPKDGTIKILAKEINDEIEVNIIDSGIGIPTSLLNSLFTIGSKSSRLGTENEPSTGLGLILCKEFVEKNNGRIWVESSQNMGTTFYFTLPKGNTLANV